VGRRSQVWQTRITNGEGKLMEAGVGWAIEDSTGNLPMSVCAGVSTSAAAAAQPKR